MTVEEFERLPEDECIWRELDEGELIEEPGPLMIHNFIRDTTTMLLRNHLNGHPEQGFVVAEEYFRLAEDILRRPDIALVGPDQFSLIVREGSQMFAPKLVVEIVSPTNTFGGMTRKLQQYFKAGVLTVWLFETDLMEIHVYTQGEKPRILTAGDTLEHPTLLPGFSVPVAKLFETWK